MKTPPPNGPLTGWLLRTLRDGDPECAQIPGPVPVPGPALTERAWDDGDLQLALWCCYELHYRGFEDVDSGWEWHPGILEFRVALERRWVASLSDLAPHDAVAAHEVPDRLATLARATGGPDLSGYVARQASFEQFAEFLAHKSVYQLKEADPHSFAIPRLGGAVKAALVEIQADEYGGGRPARMHAALFGTTMRWAGLDDEYGYYVPAVPAVTLAVSNLMSLFGLHRRWLGALLGHLAALEMTSSGPNRRYGRGARRLGGDNEACRYFDEHVEADAVHEQIAIHDLCGRYAMAHPEAAADILFGASCCLALDGQFARHVLACWQDGRPSLRLPAVTEPAA